MSAAAQTNSLPRSPSATRRQPPSYNVSPADRDRVHRTQSSSYRPSAPSTPRRSMSATRAPSSAYQHSRSPSTNLEQVARHDFEQSNLAQPQHTATPPRRAGSRDYGNGGPSRQPSHSRTQSRYNDQPVTAPAPAPASASASGTMNLRRRTTIDAQTGHWELGKTIGAGSMGKVKLARNKATGEQVAVKIVPRQSTEQEHRTAADRERADHSKEIRTAREAAIVTLADHPYICGMRDVLRTGYHWYMLFEYVNGGQMLDYIISHGRLKEKQARKFGRQIASALDYCHRNSIVHRDLKIENILISNNGDIKIIDFGLSNLFSPRDHLKTFCGSLYFAAPELLQAKAYTGPEVDVWSFGIVLYVLVCGKVPFDDQSMPQLHAKIKKGVVEYPPWLTPECRSLIARMLTTNPLERATMHEIMNHPWMTKGFNGPPENYLPERKPLQLPLDPEVVAKMTGFDFGSPEYITTQLTAVIESEEYQRAVRLQEKRLALQSSQAADFGEHKRGVFNFYKRRSSTNSKDTLTTPSSEAISSFSHASTMAGTDPINAFSPFISVYYLAREKIEREAREKNPGGLAIPTTPGEKTIPIPDLPAPEAAYTNTQTYEMAGEQPTGGRARPRARTHGEDEIVDGMGSLQVGGAPTTPGAANPTIIEPFSEPQQQQKPLSQHAKKESTAGGLFRRFSKRASVGADRTSHPPSALAAYNSTTSQADSPRKSMSTRRTRDSSQTRDSVSLTRPETASIAGSTTPKQAGLLSPPLDDGTFPATDTDAQQNAPRTKRHGLGRSISVNSSDVRRRLSRRGVSEGAPALAGAADGGKSAANDDMQQREVASDVETTRPHTTTGLASRARSMNYGTGSLARKESGSGLGVAATAPRSTRKRESAHYPSSTLPPRTHDVLEETDQEMLEEEDGLGSGRDARGGRGGDENDTGPAMKPIYLKGLFSSSTTTSRPLPIIRSDLIRVLKELGVEYKEIRGGFACRHLPSIVVNTKSPGGDDLASPQHTSPPTQHAQLASNSDANSAHRRKISFAGFRNSISGERSEDTPSSAARGKSYNSTAATTPGSNAPSDADSEPDDDKTPSFHNPNSNRFSRAFAAPSAAEAAGTTGAGGRPRPRPAGETSTHVQSDMGGAMTTLRFEIVVVKVPLLQLHGIQFKKVDGGTWQYKAMAQRILGGLRL